MDKCILELTKQERRKIKHFIEQIKKKTENSLKQLERQDKMKEYQKELEKNKEKRILCLEENRTRKIKDQVFDKFMKEYEKDGYELELKIAITEEELAKKSFYLKRINCLLLIFGFLDGIKTMVITNSTGEKRFLSLEDMSVVFLDILMEEEKELLEKNHKKFQLRMLINSIKENPLEVNHPYYLSEEEKLETYSKILEMEAKRKKLEHFQNDSISISMLCVRDFLSTNRDEIINHLFGEEQPERKIEKQKEYSKSDANTTEIKK